MDYPEHEKLQAVKGDADILAAFLEWAFFEQDWTLAGFDDDDRLWPVDCDIERLLAKYYKVDLRKIEDEKQAILDRIRNPDVG